tara:strand:+ start:130 stop:624 length:495 start_codon:yes stop_codon:yes gene_type:complete
MKITERPIPGQSLTAEPRSQPFERPSEIVDPIEAIDAHIDNLSNKGAVEDLIYFAEFGVDLVTLVQGILRSAVMEGIHSIDVSLIIAPVLHEHIKGILDASGVEYEEGFEDKEGEKVLNYRRDVERAKRMLGQLDPEPEVVEEKEEPMEIKEEPEVKTGLMARM